MHMPVDSKTFFSQDDPLWSTRTLIENSEAVKAVHKR